MRKRLVIAALLAFAFGVYPLSGCAQDAATGEQAAVVALQQGDYTEARTHYKAILDTASVLAPIYTVGYLETFFDTGAYDEGIREADRLLQQAPNDPYLFYMKGRLHVAVGLFDEADALFGKALEQKNDFWRAGLEIADLRHNRGRRVQAQRIYDALYQQYKRGTFTTAEDLAVAGRAAAAMDELHDANDALRTAAQIDERNVQVLYWRAELFRITYDVAFAQEIYEKALAVNPNRADLYIGLAEASNSFAQKEQLARTALEKNPNSVGALTILAGLRILDGQYEAAETLLDQALGVNPKAMQALAHQAAIHHLRGDAAAYQAVEQQALAVNPNAVTFFLTVNEDLTLRFRYPEAVAFARRAVEVDPGHGKANAELGASLLRVGASGEARRYLDRSFQRDPFNLFVGNTLTLLDSYADFALLESEHFRLLMHKDEAEVLGPAVLAEAEACYDALSTRYPHQAADKFLIEAYNDADDFAVRVAGVPHLGLLGVSFGDVIAMNTPRAMAGREYNWARTLWHELAHTMAIGVSKHHVPRWFTEGLSVYEEQRAHPEWGREMDLQLFSAFDQDRLHRLEEIDRGFTRPEFPGQVLLSYYHASKVIGYLVDTHGFEAIIELLEALGQGLDQEAAFQQVLGQSRQAVDTAFRATLQHERDRFDAVLAGLPDVLGGDDEEGGSLLDKLTGGTDNPLLKRLRQGREALDRQDYGTAETRFREALEIYPDFIGPGNAYQGLAAVYRARSERAKLIAALEQFLRVSEYGAEEARELGELYAEAGDTEQAAAYLARSLDVEPYDVPTHDRLATLYEARGQYAEVVRARRAILALSPVDKANAYYELARSLYHNNEVSAAKRAVLQSLELAPGYREAQKLLLACVDKLP